MSDETPAPAVKKPPRKVTLREIRQRMADEAYDRRFRADVMAKLEREVGHPFAVDPKEYAIAEAFDRAVVLIDFMISDPTIMGRLMVAAEKGELPE